MPVYDFIYDRLQWIYNKKKSFFFVLFSPLIYLFIVVLYSAIKTNKLIRHFIYDLSVFCLVEDIQNASSSPSKLGVMLKKSENFLQRSENDILIRESKMLFLYR